MREATASAREPRQVSRSPGPCRQRFRCGGMRLPDSPDIYLINMEYTDICMINLYKTFYNRAEYRRGDSRSPKRESAAEAAGIFESSDIVGAFGARREARTVVVE